MRIYYSYTSLFQFINELSLAPQIRLNSSKLLYKAFISEVHVLCLRSNVEVMYHFKKGNKIRSDLLH